MKTSQQYDSNLPVTLSHKNAWDPNLTGHVGPRAQIEKS